MEKYIIIDDNTNKILRFSDEDIVSKLDESAIPTEDILNGKVTDLPQLLIDEVVEASKWRLYPIYRFHIEFTHRESKDEEWIKDSTSFSVMFRERQDEDELNDIARKNVDNLENRYKYVGQSAMWDIKLLKFDNWCCHWFSHYTFDNGQTDEGVYNSFEEYVRRYEHMQNVFEPELLNKFRESPYGYQCLMGAEDRFRWGHWERDENGKMSDNDKFLPGPCRCPACRKRGVITIDH